MAALRLPLPAPRGFGGAFRTDDDARAVYSEAAGVAQAWPRAVAVPASADDVATLVAWARATTQPLIARGSGSSMGGGAVGDGVIVDLSRLASVGDIRPLGAHERAGLAPTATHAITCGPGALRATVDAAAAAQGLRFPVDPSSGPFCTVGGMAATNAAGPHTLSRGAMRAWVVGLECTFADGTRAWVRRGAPLPDVPAIARLSAWRDAHGAAAAARMARPVRKDASGYAVRDWLASGELVDLLVGSEGTLALFTALELALEPRPTASGTVLASFATLEAAAAAATAAHDAGAATCELLDRTLLDLAGPEHAGPVAEGAEAVLLASVEAAAAHAVPAQVAALEGAFRAAGAVRVAVGVTPDEEHGLWELRHAASPRLAALDPAIASVQVIEDACVPPEALPAYVRGVRAALDRQRFPGVIFGHAGDAHVHVNPLVDVRAPDWRPRLEALVTEVTALVAQLGGTLAGEHGDGRLRAPLSATVWGEAVVADWAAIREAADPERRFNPGVIVPLPGQPPLEAVKYDPALAPLPPAARAALDQVRATRAWARDRLALVAAHRQQR
jgi:FAD/FMN-containing dehydrogenase